MSEDQIISGMSAEQVVYKYNIRIGARLEMRWWPGRTRVTHSIVDPLGDAVTFWCATVRGPAVTDMARRVEIMPTGMPFPLDYEVLSTAVHSSGLVWHLVGEAQQ